jgi:phosphoribosyl 1,2-cyclic phosphodiesterase
MLECNFSNEILERNYANGLIERSRYIRLMESHMSLERVKDFLKANDTSKLKEIYLMHLSDSNSDAALFKKEIEQITGVPVYVC